MTPEEIKIILLNLIDSEGWTLLRQDFENKIKSLQDDINTVGNNELIYTGKDLKILELNLLKEILEFPLEYIDKIKKMEETGEQDDPYGN